MYKVAPIIILISLILGFTVTVGYSQAVQEISLIDKGLLATVKVIRIMSEESYGIADKVRLPFFDYSKKIFTYAGFTIVEGDAKAYDATIQIRAKGTPLGANYSSKGSSLGWLYEDAKIEGDLSIKIADRTLYSQSFSGESKPPYQIIQLLPDYKYDKEKDPNSAPFELLFQKVFPSTLFKMLAAIKGSEPLIMSLRDQDWWIQAGAAQILGETREPRAVEPLISLLKSSELNTPPWFSAIEALETITGEHFGSDSEKYQKWWEQNKDKLFKGR